MILFGFAWSIYLKIIEAKKIKAMRKTNFKRINVWVDLALYTKIKENADNNYLRVSTYIRQVIQQSINNNKNIN
jgi:hypothetical protein